MRVKIEDVVNEVNPPETGDFDKLWAKMGKEIKFMLNTYDPNVTWLNLYLSHDGKPGYTRTIYVTEKDE
jgi:hypothetical protein